MTFLYIVAYNVFINAKEEYIMDPTVKKRRGCLFPFIVAFFIFAAIIGGIAVGVSSSG